MDIALHNAIVETMEHRHDDNYKDPQAKEISIVTCISMGQTFGYNDIKRRHLRTKTHVMLTQLTEELKEQCPRYKPLQETYNAWAGVAKSLYKKLWFKHRASYLVGDRYARRFISIARRMDALLSEMNDLTDYFLSREPLILPKVFRRSLERGHMPNSYCVELRRARAISGLNAMVPFERTPAQQEDNENVFEHEEEEYQSTGSSDAAEDDDRSMFFSDDSSNDPNMNLSDTSSSDESIFPIYNESPSEFLSEEASSE
jgi:hypothetical protein